MNNLIERRAAIEAVGLNTWAGSRISTLPTVEAIPVAFIEEQMRNHYERAHNSALAIQQRNFDRAIALADLINDWHDWYDIWEKENETR